MKKILSLICIALVTQFSFAQDSTSLVIQSTKYGLIPTPDGSNLRLSGGSWTLEAWVFVPASPMSQQMFVIETYGYSATGGFVLRINSNFMLQAYQISSPSTSVVVNGSTTVNLGEWNHVAATFNHANSTLNLYLNGVLDGTAACSLTTSNTNDYLRIGARGDDGNIWQPIQIDDVRIWNVARTQSQIANTKNLCLSGNESGLMAYYSFEGQTTATIEDQTANGNDGSVTGFDVSLLVDGVFDCVGNTLDLNQPEKIDFAVVPNPANDFITIQTNEIIQSIAIINVVGETVITSNEKTISIADLPVGVYFVQINTTDGYQTKKLIKN